MTQQDRAIKRSLNKVYSTLLMFPRSTRCKAALAIFLITSAASMGIVARFSILGVIGQVLFILTRIWILVLPLIWFVWVDKGKPVVSLPTKQQCFIGVMLGTFMFGTVLSAYWFVGQHWINVADVQTKAQQVGLASPIIYLASASYFTFINSLAEEYIWRWFMCRQCEILLTKVGVLYFSALCFTLHHIIALTVYTGNLFVVLAGSLGVFIAGVIWSWCYLTYRSLWICYVSHLLADLAIALIGWHILFISEHSVT